MKTNDIGRALIEHFEGLRLEAYKCPAGVWTIGYGHTKDVKRGQKITPQEADALLMADLYEFEEGVHKAVGLALTSENEFSAMVSLAYNIGVGAFRTSSVLRLHKDGHHAEAGAAFKLWNKANGKVLAGLNARRAAEAELYLSHAL
jgi:lysozyme